MLRHWLSRALALCIAITPAAAQEFNIPYNFGSLRPQTHPAAAFSLTFITSFQCTADPCSSSVGLGADDDNLDVVVACGVNNTAGGITSVTVGGVTASDDITATNSPLTATIRRAALPSGGTVTVECDIGGTLTAGADVIVGVWKLIRANEAPGTTSDEQSATSAATVVTLNAVTIPTGGAAVFMCVENDDDLDGAGLWANATQQYGIDGGTTDGSTGADNTTAGTPATTCTSSVGNDTMLGVGASWDDLP